MSDIEGHILDGDVYYKITESQKDEIVKMLIQFYEKYGWHGDSIQQNDIAFLEAPILLSNIADSIIKFNYTDEIDEINEVEYND